MLFRYLYRIIDIKVGILHGLQYNRALSQMKIRLKGAQKGHSLLKKKADALTLRFRQILSKIIEVRNVLQYTLHTIATML